VRSNFRLQKKIHVGMEPVTPLAPGTRSGFFDSPFAYNTE
jgi:hypothetical protein